MDQSDPDGGGRVPDEELEEIRRQLRNALAEPRRAPAPPVAEPQRRRPGRNAVGPATMTLRFVGGFVAPGLILVMVLLVERLLG